jgi:hypothetical protein
VTGVYEELAFEFPPPRKVPLSLWRCIFSKSPTHYESLYLNAARQLELEQIHQEGQQARLELQARREAERVERVEKRRNQEPDLVAALPVSQPKAPSLRHKRGGDKPKEAEVASPRAAPPASLADWSDRFLALCDEREVNWPLEIEPLLVATIIVVGLVRPSKRAICVGERYRKERQLFRDVMNKVGTNFDANLYHSHMAWMINAGLLMQPKPATVSLDQRSHKNALGKVIQRSWERVAHESQSQAS